MTGGTLFWRPAPARRRGGSAQNVEGKASLLGALLLSSRDGIASAVGLVSREDFSKPTHCHLFDTIVTLYGAGEPIDAVIVSESLLRVGLPGAVGGKQAILRIQAGTPAAANAAHYARIVADHALLRHLVAVGSEIAELGYELPDDVTATLDRAETLVFDVANRRLTSSLSAASTWPSTRASDSSRPS